VTAAPPEPSPVSQIVFPIFVAIVGLVVGFFLGGALALESAAFAGPPRGSVTLAESLEVLVIVAILAGAIVAFVKRQSVFGWLLAGIALGAIGPAAACSSLLFQSGTGRTH
jgi:hypothetical protein